MRRIITLIIILTNYISIANAQNNWYEKYLSCVNDSDVHALKTMIEQWEQAEPESPDVYAAWYNYYIKLAMTDVVALTTTAPEDNQEALQLMDSTGVVAGYMYGIESYNDSILQIGYQKLNTAIKLFPDRLDLPFGKVAMLFRQQLYSEVMQEFRNVLDRSEKNGNRWLWTLNQPLDDGEYILKDSMQDYFVQLFNAGQSDYASQLVEWMLQLYPTDIIFCSDKASLLAIAKRYSEALPIYLSIYEDNPDDIIVASNIAHIYYTLGDKEATLKYYSKLLQCGDSEIEGLAKQRMKEAKSW
jgi:tetratricopeptide (TPR) repeat protein